MKSLLVRQVPVAWLLVLLFLAPAFGILFKLVVLDGPPAGLVITTFDGTPSPQATTLKTPTGTTVALATITRAGATLTVPSLVVATPSPSATIRQPATPSPTPGIESTPTTTIPATILVYVSGAVNKPGLYNLAPGSRVSDAVNLAGGLTPEADPNGVNLAEKVSDGAHVVVPRKGEKPPTAVRETKTPKPTATRVPTHTRVPTATRTVPTPTPGDQQATKVNINTATADDLATLPGIGPAIAAKIIAYRSEHGSFATIEDIMQVPGIKEGIFSRIRDLITVGP